ncbi:MAG: hypothetical protein IJ370_02705 [Oscillospiraceae bacterium]|nr:hypothetical protein [Oscillospiraceae bacterium]
MDNLTQELIEKYKAEMQKMISNSKTQNPQTSPPQTEEPTMQESTTQEPTTQEPTIQEERPPQIQPRTNDAFPRFEPSSDGLRLRIEEILRQNSEVTTSDDYPSPRGDSYSTQEEQMTEQNLPSDPAYETPPPMQFQSTDGDQSQNEITFESQAPVPTVEITPASMTEAEMEANETPQQTVSRVCIRGGARAQYSPPANTGSSRLPPESQNPALSDIGRLRVEAFAANRAYPISNAVIRIKNPNDNSLVAVLVTNEDGLTSSVDLPAPSQTLSQTPEFPDPFVNYSVDVRAEGYAERNDLPVQMFGGIDSVLSANLVPEEPFGRSGENG